MSDEYTTETVRSDLEQTSSWRMMQHEIGPAFDRWLAEVKREAAAEALEAEHGHSRERTDPQRDRLRPPRTCRRAVHLLGLRRSATG